MCGNIEGARLTNRILSKSSRGLERTSSRTVSRAAKYTACQAVSSADRSRSADCRAIDSKRVTWTSHIQPQVLQSRRQLQSPGDRQADDLRPVDSVASVRVPDRPLTDATLRGRLMQGDIGFAAVGQYLDLVEVKVNLARKLQADEPGSLALQGDTEWLLIRMAAKDSSIVSINDTEFLPVARQQHLDLCRSVLKAIASVIDPQSAQRDLLAQVDLPPGITLQFRVESPFAVDDAVASSDRIFGWCDLGRSRRQSRVPQSGLYQPVGFKLRTGDRGNRRADFAGLSRSVRATTARTDTIKNGVTMFRRQVLITAGPSACRYHKPAIQSILRHHDYRRQLCPSIMGGAGDIGGQADRVRRSQPCRQNSSSCCCR